MLAYSLLRMLTRLQIPVVALQTTVYCSVQVPEPALQKTAYCCVQIPVAALQGIVCFAAWFLHTEMVLFWQV